MTALLASPQAAMLVLSSLGPFLLVTTAAYLCALLLARLATSASSRCTHWTGYLCVTTAFWLFSIGSLVRSVSLPAAPASAHAPETISSTGAHAFALPLSIAPYLGLTLAVASALYILIIVALLVRGAWTQLRLARVLAFRSPASPALTARFNQLAEDMGIAHCRLWILPGLTTPAAIGVRGCDVYLPSSCSDEQPELEDILRHELCHVRRRDNLRALVAGLCRILLFFHPCVHWAAASIRLQREVACDMAVIRTRPEQRDVYADTLVRFGRKTAEAREPDYLEVHFAAQASVLQARVLSILAGERAYSSWSRRGRMLLRATALWLFAVTVPVLWIRFELAGQLPSGAAVLQAALHPRIHAARKSSHSLSVGSATRSLAAAPEQALAQALTQPEALQQRAQSAASLGGLPALEPARLPEVRYQGTHALHPSGPQTGPQTAETSPSGSEVSSESRKAPAYGAARQRESTLSIVLGAAIELGRLGTGGDRDHDHD